MTDKTHNGWENYETWNVALWIGNDEGLYQLGRESRDYAQFVSVVSRLEAAGSNVVGIVVQTPDGVAWSDPNLDTEALDDMIEEL